jgi:NAD(P)-dependent dehydrogenase (short-subunit alcohol dehydrogenase family)
MNEMKNRVCIVTGSNSGIGKETALALSGMRATVVMVVRNRERGERARAEIYNARAAPAEASVGQNNGTICAAFKVELLSRISSQRPT